MQTQKFLVVLMTVASLTLASCATATLSADTSKSVQNTSWSLVTLPNQPLVPDTQITLNVDNDKMTGSDGCNRYNASYTLNADNININKNVATIMMACPEPIMRQASSYISALTQATGYKIEGEQLTLLDTAGKPLAAFKKQSVELSGTSWRVTNINNGKQAVTSLVNDSTLTSVFSADGRLSGSAGCNNYNSSYNVAKKTLRIGEIVTTCKMCAKPTGVMEQEALFLKALATVATYQVDGKRLELRTADGALAVMLISQ
ncbi:MAG: META domain-containing protein [Methylococcales bacterium]|nr:META domain-containing protein [Methylococcales bacterium]